MEKKLREEIDEIVFTKTNEILATRYEERFESLRRTVVALRLEVEGLRAVVARVEATADRIEKNQVRPVTSAEVGSAPADEPSTPTAVRSHEAVRRTSESVSDRVPNAGQQTDALRNVVGELSATVQGLQN